MREGALDKRLYSAAQFVRQDAVFADIGTDHAYLPIFLLREGRIRRAFCSDVNEGPLNKAKENAIDSGIVSGIEFYLTDGAAELSGKGITDFAICGMGGELIAHIIDCEEMPIGTRFILNPMTKQEELRSYLCTHGYEIIDDDTVFSDKKYYQIIYAEKTGKPQSLPDRITQKFGKYNLEKRTDVFCRYLEKTLRELKYAQSARAAAGLASPDDALILEIEEFLSENKN